jgi:predicted RNA-binding protein with PUA-like domain
MKYWLIKSEADCYSIDDLMRDKTTSWSGVRNYQARNFMRDDMSIGDFALFYHSNSASKDFPTGIYGIAKVCSEPHADDTAINKKDEHFDRRSFELYQDAKRKDLEFKPIWTLVDFKFYKKFKKPLPLKDIKSDPHLKDMLVCQKGSRLSIQPVLEKHFKYILDLHMI